MQREGQQWLVSLNALTGEPIWKAPIADAYRNSALFKALRDPSALLGRCGRCEFARICGGSRSRAYGLTGDPFETDPWCSYEPLGAGVSS